MKRLAIFFILVIGIFSISAVKYVVTGGDLCAAAAEATTPADVTGGADGTYTYYLDMQYYGKLGIQMTLDGGSGTVTATIEATMQDDETAQESCTYVDVTDAVFGAASFTASTMLMDDTGALSLARYVKIKIVVDTSGADDADWTIFARRTK